MSLTMLATTTALGIAARDVVSGKDPMARYSAEKIDETAIEIVDRSGALGWMSNYVNAALKASGMTASSRYAQNGAWETLAGVNFAGLSQLGRFMSSLPQDLRDGNTDAVATKAERLAPFAFHVRLLRRLLEGAGITEPTTPQR